MNTLYKMRVSTTPNGNLVRVKVYEQKSFLGIKYWAFMCNQDGVEQARTLMTNLAAINK